MTVSDDMGSISRQSKDGKARLAACFDLVGENYIPGSLFASKTEHSNTNKDHIFDYVAGLDEANNLHLEANDRLGDKRVVRTAGPSGVGYDILTSFALSLVAPRLDQHPFLDPLR